VVSEVGRQLTFLREPLITLSTLVGLLSCVSPLVLQPPCLLHEAFPTEAAVDSELLQMNLLMSVSPSFGAKNLSTDRTHQGLAAIVIAGVDIDAMRGEEVIDHVFGAVAANARRANLTDGPLSPLPSGFICWFFFYKILPHLTAPAPSPFFLLWTWNFSRLRVDVGLTSVLICLIPFQGWPRFLDLVILKIL